jgi:hypothetical protein
MSKTISMVFGIALALPVVKARNSFRFERDSADFWTATLSYARLPRSPRVNVSIAGNAGPGDQASQVSPA